MNNRWPSCHPHTKVKWNRLKFQTFISYKIHLSQKLCIWYLQQQVREVEDAFTYSVATSYIRPSKKATKPCRNSLPVFLCWSTLPPLDVTLAQLGFDPVVAPCLASTLVSPGTTLTTHRAILLTIRGKEGEKIPSPEWEGDPASAAAPAVSAAALPATNRHVTLMKKEAWGLSYFSLFL